MIPASLTRAAFLALAVVVLLAIGLGITYVVVFGLKEEAAAADTLPDRAAADRADDSDDEEGERRIPTVRVVRPKLNREQLVQSVTQPVYVQAYYRASIMARVAGTVKDVYKR